jgi:hypothetical protein
MHGTHSFKIVAMLFESSCTHPLAMAAVSGVASGLGVC